ncbi:MAG: hypothetical protein GQ477_02160 [Nanohaloarchaea archaeon]|nr:hypothetical protein [Candidatus Nanohaloarchaea archaeon]
MFLRKKIIKGHEYWYLVENKWIDGKSRQRVVRYLGSRGNFDMGAVVREIEKDKLAKKEKKHKTQAKS